MIRRFAALCLLSLASLNAKADAAPPRPNFLLIIADDWSWPHAGIYGDRAARTPRFDRLASQGMLFENAFAIAPSCSPSRAALLTGQAPHRLEEAGNLYGIFPTKFTTYPELLEAAGYFVGSAGKGWGPGDWKIAGRRSNPAGREVGRPYGGLREFLAKRSKTGAPFCYWMGGREPHRPFTRGRGEGRSPLPQGLQLPPFLPDTPMARQDLADYYSEVERFDAGLGETLDALDEAGLSESTLILVTSDNGMPFPRAKANLYDAGTHVPLLAVWPGHVKSGTRSEAFVDLTDLAPTLLETAGLAVPRGMTGRSLLGLLRGQDVTSRDRVFLERERHADCREGHKSYPMRAVRTRDLLYIRNLRPELWPAGDPPRFDDIDGSSPSKKEVLARWNKRKDPLARLALDKRPAEELYDLIRDPNQMTNVAGHQQYSSALHELRAELEAWMKRTDDPRVAGDDTRWDRYEYFKGEK